MNDQGQFQQPLDSANDPVIEHFLEFIAKDLAEYPARIQAVDPRLARYIDALVREVTIDLDSPLSAADN